MMSTSKIRSTQELRRTRRQVRGFVLVWAFITLVMGAATFLAIFFAYNPLREDDNNNASVALPRTTGTEVVIVLASPTFAITPTTAEVIAVPTQVTPVILEVAQVPTELPSLIPTDVPPATEAPPPTATPTPLPVSDERFAVGIQVQYSLDLNPANQDGFYNSVATDLGLGWVKQQVRWEDVEPQPDQYDWSKLDLVMPSAGRFGLKTLLSIVTAPDWAREAGVDLSRHGPPANNRDYVDFVLAILARYPGQIHAIEVWNEMNLDREWTSIRGLSAPNYVALLRDTYNAVKAVDSGIIIISGALSPTGVDDGVAVINDFRYMDMLITAGVLDYSDCVGAHHNGINMPPSISWDAGYNDPTAIFRGPFDNPHHSWSFRSTLEGYATRIRAAGRDTKLCVTEFGWASAEDLAGYPPGFEFAQDNTLEEQALWITEAMTNMQQWDFVWLAIIWNFNYAPQAGWATNNDNVPYSLIGPNWVFRPAYDAIREWQTNYMAQLTGAS